MPYLPDGSYQPYDRSSVYDQTTGPDADRTVDITDPDRDLPIEADGAPRDVYAELAWARDMFRDSK